MAKKETYTEKEVQKMIIEAQKAQARIDYGRQWFIEALAHTANLVNQGAFPEEAHRMGLSFYSQFTANTQPQPPEEKKPDEKEEEVPPTDE